MSDYTDDFLEHYGVVGMKWGKHKSGSGGSGGSSSGGKKARIDKTDLKIARKAIYKNAGASVKANKGKTVVAALLAGGSATAGITLARAAGHSKGKSLAIGLLGGAPGGVIAVELAARKAARGED